MTILVSGASGFLGSKFVKRLADAGRDIVAVSRSAVPAALASYDQIRWIIQDIDRDGLESVALPELEAVVHLAGATLGASSDEEFFLYANETTTVRLFQACADKTDRFIFASSQVVYGDPRQLAVTEDYPLVSGESAYACSKINSENWLRWFQRRHGGQYLILRFCGFIDGGGIIDYMIERALSEEPIELYSYGAVRRDYIPVEKAIDALMAALECKVDSGFLPVNIGSGQVVSASELAKLICAEIDSSSRIELSSHAAPQGDFVFSIDRARNIFGFDPGDLISAVRTYARQKKYVSGVKEERE